MSRIENKIAKMLKENTGRALGDSGDAYGRHWQRNQNRNFKKENEIDFELFEYNNGKVELTFSVNLYHYLVNKLEMNERTDYLNKKFKKWWKELNEDDDYERYSSFIEYVGGTTNMKYMDNTYNYDCNLSQTIQFQTFEFNNYYFIILEIHGGCDVRGGYTDPYIFEIDDEYFDFNPMVYGTIDGIEVDTCYNGCSLTDEDGKEIDVTMNSKIELSVC